MNKLILKTVVGSRAHGLDNENSDYDYRSVYVQPTTEILSLNHKYKGTNWVEGKEDDTQWEIGHFLSMAVKSNPTILEVFLAPKISLRWGEAQWGYKLCDLFDHVWSSIGVANAFVGYGRNQRKKFLEEKDNRPNKFAAAYLRSLYNGYELLSTGKFTVRIVDLEIGKTVKRFKEGDYTFGEVIDTCRHWENEVTKAYEQNPNKKTDYEKVNAFLIDVRKNFWSFDDIESHV